MELIGKKVRGFKFESYDSGNPYYSQHMDKHINEIGLIVSYQERKDLYVVDFSGKRWEYPANLIKEHLVEEIITDKQVDTITLPLINGVPDLSEFEGVEMMVSDEGENWFKCKVLACNSKQNWYVTPYDVYTHAKPILEKKKITAEDIKKMFNCDDFEIV